MLRPKPGIVLNESGGDVDVLLTSGETVTFPAADLERMKPVAVPGPEVKGAAGRLWRVREALRSGEMRGKWVPSAISGPAAEHAGATLAYRRQAALDAIALGLADEAADLGLTASEVAWYQAWQATQNGDTATALDWLERLPTLAYGARVALLMSRAGDLLAHLGLGTRALPLLRPFGSLRSRVLSAALGMPGERAVTLLMEYAQGEHAAVASAIKDLSRVPAKVAAELPITTALSAYATARAGASLDSVIETLVPLPTPLLDELIDARKLTRPPQDGLWPADLTAYLRARIDPGGTTEPELMKVGFTAEAARRRYLAHDESSLAALPADDPAVLHYRALLRARMGTTQRHETDLRPQARHLMESIVTFAEGEPPEDVIADASCWPLLRTPALTGKIKLSDATRAQYPHFAAWVDLCEMQQLLFEERWHDVGPRGAALTVEPQLEIMRDEAKNMMAFAAWQLGRNGEALHLLDQALEGQFSTGLVVNASIVAAEQGSRVALPYMARAFRLASDPQVRTGALLRAVGLWNADAGEPDYPEVLREMVREALGVYQPDNDHQRLLLILACVNDDAWLADTTRVWIAGDDQRVAWEYYRLRARVSSAAHSETLVDLARLIAHLASAPVVPEWMTTEVELIADLLDEMVHVPFGEAAYLVPAIDVLVTAHVLALHLELVLSAQATAHLAMHLKDQHTPLPPPLEQRLFEHVATFRARREEMTEDAQVVALAELTKCVEQCSFALAVVTEGAFERLGGEWNDIVNRLSWDQQNRYALNARKRVIHDQLRHLVTRLDPYLRCLDSLPLSDSGREIKQMIGKSARRWSGELARLGAFL